LNFAQEFTCLLNEITTLLACLQAISGETGHFLAKLAQNTYQIKNK